MASAAVSAAVVQWQAIRVAIARRDAGVNYPAVRRCWSVGLGSWASWVLARPRASSLLFARAPCSPAHLQMYAEGTGEAAQKFNCTQR